ncbi:MAG TPA: hypothetical protein EYN14_09315 [Alphaproteobacteria bacterium]|jgi:hypothetical protein|nr:hypothetical protein [Alphaproteobacteria bacterium]
MNGNEKRTNEYKIRFTDTEALAISKLAHVADRTVGDYIHHEMKLVVFGHLITLEQMQEKNNETHRDS